MDPDCTYCGDTGVRWIGQNGTSDVWYCDVCGRTFETPRK